MHHRKPAGRHRGRHRAPLDVRSRYAVVVTTAVVGAGVVAFGASSALPTVNTGDASALGAGGATSPHGAALANSGANLNQARTATPARASRAQTRVAAPKPAPGWVRPSPSALSSTFGPRWGTFHYGIDFAAPFGSVIHAAHAGVVVKAGWYGGYGNIVIIDHGNGITTRYGHNSKVMVRVGQRVTAGQEISLVGSTGDSTGPHCHFEVRIDDVAVNPIPYLLVRGIDLRQNYNPTL
ncbi:MAG TPA: M23 family metallopeptidase [Mycobacteriales bacterium]|nr:peptidase [Mycobacterium sp.]